MNCPYCQANLKEDDQNNLPGIFWCPSLAEPNKDFHIFDYYSEDEFTFKLSINKKHVTLSKDPWNCYVTMGRGKISEIEIFEYKDVVNIALKYISLIAFT
jgi:hypothetical protein